MKKNFMKVALFGALTLAAGASFVGCKDYDDDIDNLQSQITANADAIKQLKDLVAAGKYVSNVTKEGDGIKITWNDGSSNTIQTIKGEQGTAGKNGTVVTIVDGYWAFDGVKSEYPAKGDKGDKGENGQDGAAAAAGHDAKISEDGYWMVWDTTLNDGKGDWVKTEYIAGGATAVEEEHGWTINIKDENGKLQSIFIPNSAELLSITPELNGQSYSQDFDIYYGILNQDVKWRGAKANNGSYYKATDGGEGSMLTGMYPTTDRDIKVLLNPTGVDANVYTFAFTSTDNTTPWGLTFKAPQPWEGKATVDTRAAVTSKNGIWVLPRNAQRYELKDVQGRPDYALQFKSNDGAKYVFAMQAYKEGEEDKTVKSPYAYTFKASNINAVTNIQINGLTFQPSGKTFVYGKEYTPNFDMFGSKSDAYDQWAEDSVLIYDSYLEIDKTKITDESIRKYGLKISDDGYRFIAENAAVVNNTVWFKYNYILINGKTGSANFGINFNDEETTTENQFIGDFTAPFNAVLAGNSTYVLNHVFSLDKFFATLGEAGKLKWIDAIARSMGNATDANEINKSIFSKKISNGQTIYNVELLGGDPINNQAAWDVVAYNGMLLNKYIGFDYVDSKGKTCLTGNIRDLDNIAGLRVYFIADNNLSSIVQAPYYTENNQIYNGQRAALPLNNAFRIEIATRYDQYEVSKMNFSFELQMPTNCPIKRQSVGNDNSKWDGNALIVYGEKAENNVNVDMRDAFSGTFQVTETNNSTYPYSYGAMNVEAGWYKMAIATTDGTKIIGINNGTASLAQIANSAVYTAWNTTAPISVVFNGNVDARPVYNINTVTYDHFNVYHQALSAFSLKFASKVEDGTATAAGTAENPFIAVANYDANRNITSYTCTVANGNFTMKDAFSKPYSLFDNATVIRAKLHKMLIEDRNGIITSLGSENAPTYYGLYPSATIDGQAAGALVKFELVNANNGNHTGLKITVDKSVGSEKNIAISLKVTDVFAGAAGWQGSEVVNFIVRAQNN